MLTILTILVAIATAPLWIPVAALLIHIAARLGIFIIAAALIFGTISALTGPKNAPPTKVFSTTGNIVIDREGNRIR
jgi:hypothetical protein